MGIPLKKMLVVMTRNEKSLDVFKDENVKRIFEIEIVHYEDAPEKYTHKIINNYNYVYFRDPFNTVEPIENLQIEKIMDYIYYSNPDAIYIDGVKTFTEAKDVEDKLNQYLEYASFMPKTRLLGARTDFRSDMHIIKKRVSCRAKGIYFKFSDKYLDGNYIVQEKLNILNEYRVYCVDGEVIPYMCPKQSKSLTKKVVIQGVEPISDKVDDFAKIILAKTSKNMNLIGMDICIDKNSKPWLIEVNRSPQFGKFNEMSGVNLFYELLKSRV